MNIFKADIKRQSRKLSINGIKRLNTIFKREYIGQVFGEQKIILEQVEEVEEKVQEKIEEVAELIWKIDDQKDNYDTHVMRIG